MEEEINVVAKDSRGGKEWMETREWKKRRESLRGECIGSSSTGKEDMNGELYEG